MDKLTFEEYCTYMDKGITILPLDGCLEDKTIKVLLCKNKKELKQTNERLFIFNDCYFAIKDHPNEKEEVMKALIKYERTGEPFVIGYNYWESSEEPPKDFRFININWGV